MRRKWYFIAPLGLIAVSLFVFLGGEIVKALWNTLLPQLFGWPELTFWQALGLLVLCRILFGGMSMHSSARSNMRRRMGERWQRMTPEERERFRQRFGRCGENPPPAGPAPA